VNYINLAVEAFDKVKETAVLAHADEFETSLYLHLAPERVQMDKVGAGDDVMGEYMSSDSMYTYPVRFNDFWGRWTNLGVHGDARPATAEKGKVILEAAVGALINIVHEWREWPIAERMDQHTQPVQKQIRW
jgi:creatinine amidohydrolase